VARADFDYSTGEWRMLTKPGSIWKRGHTEIAPLEQPQLMSLGMTDATVLVSTRSTGEWQTHEVSLADGSWSAARPDLDADSILLDPASKRPIGTIDMGLATIDYKFFADADQRMVNSLTKAFPGDLVSLVAWSDDRMTVIVHVEGTTNGNAFFIVNRRTKTASKLADAYPGVAAAGYAPVSAIHYAAADGLDIPAYLTLPKGVPAKNLPLIVLPHGGPSSRDDPGFDWWAQALASRGYAVLQPQFRGSAGFKEAHRDAGFGEWGRKMQTDLSDGVRYLAKAGTIDPRRVCIAGASYGGYAALAGVTLDPGVYRCASSVAGISDLRQWLVSEVSHYGGERRDLSQRYLRRFLGVANSDDPKLLALSPARHAGAVKVPVQLIHGKDDTVVSYEQSVTMDKALQAAGAKPEFITLEGEDHWLSRSTTRKQMLAAQIAFLEKHNPPGAP
jgi:dipeptidyl aminopeptidase/acylaminoacyl peptidase